MSSTVTRDRAPRSRWRTWVSGTAMTAAAVLIGLSGAGVTQAYLTASAPQPGATLTAGTAAIQVNGASTANLGSRALTPNTPAVWSFTVSNTGSVKMNIAALVSAPATSGYATSTRAILAQVSGPAACTASLGAHRRRSTVSALRSAHCRPAQLRHTVWSSASRAGPAPSVLEALWSSR